MKKLKPTTKGKWEIDHNDGSPGLVFVERNKNETKYYFGIYGINWGSISSEWYKTVEGIAKVLNKAKFVPIKTPTLVRKKLTNATPK